MKPLSNFDINKVFNKDKSFIGCYMKDELNSIKNNNEYIKGVLNLDDSNGNGTHWTCWVRNKNLILYFDSFGLPPPLEFITYHKNLLKDNYKGIYYNSSIVQKYDTIICGHLCIYVLEKAPKTKKDFIEIIHKILDNFDETPNKTIIIEDIDYLKERLKLLISSKKAGNTTVVNEISDILKYFYEKKIINLNEFKKSSKILL